MKVVVVNNQTIWDVATQYTGDSGNAIAILLHNKKESSDLIIGETLIVSDELASSKHIAFYASRNIDVATSSTPLIVGDYESDAENDSVVDDPIVWAPPAKIYAWGVDLMDSQTLDYTALFDMKIRQPYELLRGVGVLSIEVNDAPYVTGDVIMKGDKITFTTTDNGSFKIIIEKV